MWLTIVPDTLIAPTGELAIGLVIGLMRRITEGHDHVRGGGFAGWRPQLYGSTLQGATVGLLGMGQLGQAVARRLAGFESQVLYHDARRLDAQTERALAVSYHGLVLLARDKRRHSGGAAAVRGPQSAGGRAESGAGLW